MKKFLFLPGGLLVVAAVLRAALAARWDVASVMLAAGGALAFVIGVAANWADVRAWFRDPRGVFLLNSVFTTVLLLAILGLVNAVATLRGWRADLTMAGRNTLAVETRDGIARLTSDVTLTQFGRSRDAGVDDLLASFSRASRRVTTVFADAERLPQQARQFGVVRDGTVIVAAGARWRKVDRPTEPALYQAILQVTNAREPAVCVTSGLGEHGLDDASAGGVSQFGAALVMAGYRVTRTSLLGDLPASCEVLVVAGPTTPPGAESLARLERFVGSGGRLALLVDPPVSDTLRPWLLARGIVVGDGVIVETGPAGRQVGAGPESPLALAYFNHPITRGFELAAIFDRSVPLAVKAPAPIGQPVPLAGTGEGAFERRGAAGAGTTFRDGVDRRGPFLLGVASTLPRGLGDTPATSEGRFVVFGDSDFVTNAWLGRQGNRDLALRVVAWLAGEEEVRTVGVPDRQNRRIALTERTRVWMYVVNLGVLPLLPLIAGLIVLARVRRKGRARRLGTGG